MRTARVRGQRELSQVLGAFGPLGFTMLRPVLAWRAFWNLWTIYFFNFQIFFRAAVNRGYWIGRYGGTCVCVCVCVSPSLTFRVFAFYPHNVFMYGSQNTLIGFCSLDEECFTKSNLKKRLSWILVLSGCAVDQAVSHLTDSAYRHKHQPVNATRASVVRNPRRA
jgi:hypothetical protein